MKMVRVEMGNGKAIRDIPCDRVRELPTSLRLEKKNPQYGSVYAPEYVHVVSFPYTSILCWNKM